METKYGFIKLSPTEFEKYIDELKIARTVVKIQQHHAYIPSYVHFNGNNHFERQKGMQQSHLNNGWSDIGQHFSIFPDGMILTGRSLEQTPAGIKGANTHAICIENVGDFDKGKDEMNAKQKDAIVAVTAALCKKFNLTPNTNNILYHHWYRLDNGIRNNGAGGNKSCPGTNFFGGNKVEDCEKNFLPLVIAKSKAKNNEKPIVPIKYVYVLASSLRIRKGPATTYALVTDRMPAMFGAVLRVYEQKAGWFRISSSAQHWVSAAYTKEVKRAVVNASTLNVRSGPGTGFSKNGSLNKGDEVFVYETKNGWCRIGIELNWVTSQFLDFQ